MVIVATKFHKLSIFHQPPNMGEMNPKNPL